MNILNQAKLRVSINKKFHIMKKKKNPGRVYLLSYPKCGRHWVQSIIGKYILLKFQNNDYFRKKPQTIITNTKDTTKFDLLELVCTHGEIEGKGVYIKDIFNDSDSTIMLLNRNIFDILVSDYFHIKYRNNLLQKANPNFNYRVYHNSISDFIRDENYGIERIIKFYEKVYRYKHLHNNVFEFSYEDMLNDPKYYIKKIIEMMEPLETNISDNIIKKISNYTSFENMTLLEQNSKIDFFGVDKNLEIPKRCLMIREAKIHEYKKYLNTKDIQYIKNILLDVNPEILKLMVI